VNVRVEVNVGVRVRGDVRVRGEEKEGEKAGGRSKRSLGGQRQRCVKEKKRGKEKAGEENLPCFCAVCGFVCGSDSGSV